MHPFGLRPFLQGDLEADAHPAEELDKRLRFGGQDVAGDHPAARVSDRDHGGCLMHVQGDILRGPFHESGSWLRTPESGLLQGKRKGSPPNMRWAAIMVQSTLAIKDHTAEGVSRMTPRLIWFALCAVGGLAAVSPLRGQATNPAALVGVDSVDAQVNLTWDRRLTQPDEETTRSRLQTLFELELRKHGIVVSTGASNFLNMDFTSLYNDAGTVSYSYAVRLREPGMPRRTVLGWIVAAAVAGSDSSMWRHAAGPDSVRVVETMRAGMWDRFTTAYRTQPTMWVTTWEGPAGVAHVGRLNLRESLERQAVEGVQAFANAFMASRRE